ncbi:hypothetical protein CCM_03573 [Cordyceps militaris CM01]|uniref:Uncharacterized protein n=1 Tax=Cordyceps militaris (strain CM01) TaxID=983644 RepID=G3JBJ6_CORMM|nr:uncharacterized protein CCM_03573 [Cordyceps militaris CM01]EGX95301.1 hypothetical protein CCM_03573 [Cordyceps militaris CM01]
MLGTWVANKQSSLTLSALKDFSNRDDAGFRSKQAGRLQQPDAFGFKSEVVDTYPEYGGVAYLHQTELDSFLAGACADLDDTT